MGNFVDLINSDKPVLVDFFATWCGPCQRLSPTLKQLKDYWGERITILKIDVDKNEQLVSHYQVGGVPTMMLFQNGKQLWRQSGLISKEDMVKVIVERSY